MLQTGSRLGPFEIIGPIGAGGMGEVYRARDTRLQRDVALKILPEGVAQDRDRLARFAREAQVLASLNHPNIAQIYGLEDSALVMELVDGPTLADRIAQGPLPVDEALAIARQIVDALDAAHEQGIVHRDLKPANIKVRPDGTVKVLDFGLAKAFGGDGSSSGSYDFANSPTVTSPAMTMHGVILGTAAYMSPEQARGKPVDKRADIWAFGCVLFEMLTGQRAFEDDDVSMTLSKILRVEPSLGALPQAVPANVRQAISVCLRKDPKQRVSDIRDARLAIDGAFDVRVPGDQAAAVAPAAKSRVLIWLAAGVLTGVAGTAAVWWSRSGPAPPAIVRLSVAHPSREALGSQGYDLAFMPDGKRIAYMAGPASEKQIYIRPLDSLVATPLGAPGANGQLFVSSDGEWVGYIDYANRLLKKIHVGGGGALTILKYDAIVPAFPVWHGDSILFGSAGATGRQGLWRVPEAGGTPEEVFGPQPGAERIGRPHPLPGGRHVLFDSAPRGAPFDESQIEVLDLVTKQRKVLVRGGTNPRYVEPGYLLFAVEGGLRAVAFDPSRLEVSGAPVSVLQDVVTKTPGFIADVSLSQTGSMLYMHGNNITTKRLLVWVDRQGREEAIPAEPRAYAYARVSPDGTRIALDVREGQNDIWIWDIAHKTSTRLTFDPGLNRAPVWVPPDGKRVAFSLAKDGVENVYWQVADGSSPAEPLTTSRSGTHVPYGFSPDGKQLLFGPGGGPFDIRILPVDTKTPADLLATQYDETSAEVSPNGRWLAYQVNDSGRNEIYLRSFPDVSRVRRQVSTEGGTRPMWSRDSSTLYFSASTSNGQADDAAAGTVMAVPIGAGPQLTLGTPTPVVRGPYLAPQAGRPFDIGADGRFVMIKDARPAGEADPRQLVVVQNWVEELKRLVPAK